MRRWTRYMLLVPVLAIVQALSSCSTTDEPEYDNNGSSTVSLVFTVSNATESKTRMSDAVVQVAGQDYRGIEMRRIVPFAIATEKVTASDMPKAFLVYGNGEKPVEARAYYYYNDCVLMRGVNAFLCYGKATQVAGKAVNGSIVETFPVNMAPKDTRFALESISEHTAHTTATALANYMTNIANAEGNSVKWENAPSATLKLMRMNFLNQVEKDGNGEPAANIKAYTQTLKTTLNDMTLTGDDDAIRTAIITAIGTYSNSWGGFPASIGLPDGAAVIRWTGTAFEPQLTTTTLADINGIERFAYPAELYYYCNSRIRTSNIDKREESYTNRDWSAILNDYENENGVVSGNTTAVAIKDPMQYGVAHVQITLKKTDSSTLKDAAGTSVTVESTSFPLTGIIIGGQLPVGFDFKPATAYPVYSEADMKFVYDSQVPTLYLSSSSNAEQNINTLVLQSYDGKKVPVVLEFQNNSNVDFKGLNGTVQKGTKFYLVGEIDPADGTSGETSAVGRVFTQDHTTTMSMKVAGLEKAYNVVPNLLSPRLEMGVELVTKWVATTPEEILF